jgi:hypothetical protein
LVSKDKQRENSDEYSLLNDKDEPLEGLKVEFVLD